jgi:hypothetical protein
MHSVRAGVRAGVIETTLHVGKRQGRRAYLVIASGPDRYFKAEQDARG